MTGRQWVTYRRTDGEFICGEYAWVDSAAFFESDDEPTEIVKETWALVSEETITFGANEADDEDGAA